MGYLNLMILLSRYIFAGFGILFVIVAFSAIKPFINYSMGTVKQRNKFLSVCLYCFHLAGISILISKEVETPIRILMITNGGMMLLLFIISLFILRMMNRKEEIVLWQLMYFLMDIGFLMLLRLDPDIASKQLISYIIGAVVGLSFPSIFSVIIKPQNKYVYLTLLSVMMILPFIAGDKIYGATNWVTIGPVSFQPSEIGKVALILFLASTLSNGASNRQNKELVFPITAVVVSLLCLVIQKDLGTMMLYYVTTLLMLLVATQSFVMPLIGGALGAVGAFIGYLSFGHVQNRVEAWLNPWAHFDGSGYQVIQGLFAMGTWGWLGSGLTRGNPKDIPIAVSDYIFPAICEEFGNIIGIVILCCYLGIVLLCLQVAFRYSHQFYRLVIVGISSLFCVQVFIIIGGILRIIPLTGITTPFMSAGGTSIIVSMGMIGLITYFSYKARTNEEKEVKRRETR